MCILEAAADGLQADCWWMNGDDTPGLIGAYVACSIDAAPDPTPPFEPRLVKMLPSRLTYGGGGRESMARDDCRWPTPPMVPDVADAMVPVAELDAPPPPTAGPPESAQWMKDGSARPSS
jgi:hypothetical protein